MGHSLYSMNRRFSQSAAYARQARISSSVRYRDVIKNLLLRHTRSQILQHLVDCNSHPADTSRATAFARLDSDDVLATHALMVELTVIISKSSVLQFTNCMNCPIDFHDGRHEDTNTGSIG